MIYYYIRDIKLKNPNITDIMSLHYVLLQLIFNIVEINK